MEDFDLKESSRLPANERDRYRAIFQSMAEPAFVVDHSLRLITVNRAFEKFFGFGEDEIKGKKCSDVLDYDLCGACPLLQAMKGRSSFSDVGAVMSLRGVRKNLLISGSFLDETGSESPGGIVVIQDITGQMQMEAAWRSAAQKAVEEKNKLDAIIAALGEGVSIQDTEYRVLYQNQYHKDMVGDHVGEYCFKGYRNMDRVCDRCHLASSFKDGVIHREEQSRLTDSGVINYEIIASPLRNASGQIVAGIELVRDITERKKVEEELTLHKNQLEDLVRERTAEFMTAINFLQDEIDYRRQTEETLRENEAKMRHLHGMKVLGELAAGVAHEVRNPLHALMSVTEALKKELKDNPDYDIFLFHIREQVERLSVLMKDLLDLGKPIEPSHIRPEPLSEICLASIDLWKKSPSRKAQSITFVQSPADNALVDGDSQRLQQVFLNLLENAAQHSPDNSEIQVVMLAAGKDRVSVKVIDRGSGIPEEILPRIFEPFFTTRRRGTGLGLSIIKNILEGHGGSLEVRNNNPLPGCTAEVNLPYAKKAKP
jgi:PAS domain S-box-containing protein